jgi:hypothetical protein
MQPCTEERDRAELLPIRVREIKSTAEGTFVKAMKNGKEVSLVVDSSGQIQERR